MRRFRDSDGVEYDEIPDGNLRRRLKADDPSPIPEPQTRKAIERRMGPLREVDAAVLAGSKKSRPLPPREPRQRWARR
jgi:hypothetical protein